MSEERTNPGPAAGRSCGFSIGITIDRAIADVAASQFGRVSRPQLLAIGASDNAIAHRVRSGRLRRVRPGVYAIGGSAEGSRERCAAALLDVGPSSLVSHLSAAAEHGMRRPSPLVVDVTTPRRLPVRDGIRIHTRAVDPQEAQTLDGLPATSPARTLFDLGTMLGSKAHAAAANQAFVDGLVTLGELYATGELNARCRGATAFKRLLATLDPEGRRIRSSLEARLNDFLRARRFPPWEQNVRMRIGTDEIEADVLWRQQRVIVEADGRNPHLAPLTFVSDRRRDRRVQVEGWFPVRITWTDLDDRPDELEDDPRALLRKNARVRGSGPAKDRNISGPLALFPLSSGRRATSASRNGHWRPPNPNA